MAISSPYFLLSAVRGFHVYRVVWTSVQNAEYSTQEARENSEDHYAESEINIDQVVGHVLFNIIEREGKISCKIAAAITSILSRLQLLLILNDT